MSRAKKNQLGQFGFEGLARRPIQRVEGRYVFDHEDHRLVDYCTTNYLGFDFLPELHARGSEYARSWGSLTGWSRLEADPRIYSDLEGRLSRFLGVKDSLLAHTITITGFSVMSAIVEKGTIFLDEKIHTVVYEAARLARDHGATLVRFKHQDAPDLAAKLAQCQNPGPKLIAVDGVYSISTEIAPILPIQDLAAAFNAWVYVDDAHGFGVLGQRHPFAAYGAFGNGVVHYCGGDFKRTFYVSSFGKAFCTHSAFITIPDQYEEELRYKCMQYIYSAPLNPYVIGTADAAMSLNERLGEAARARLLKITQRFVRGLRALHLEIENVGHFPVVFWKVGSLEKTVKVAHALIKGGVLAGLRAYPVVPPEACGLRFGLTALHTEAQIDETLNVIAGIKGVSWLEAVS